jgi:hypothetical protein
MRREKNELIEILQKSLDILEAKPELYKMDKSVILNCLDDGSKEMLNIRWMVLAKVCVENIDDYTISELVHSLSNFDNGVLTYEYMGFILSYQKEVNLIKLLIEASQKNLYSNIFPYIESNIIFETNFSLEDTKSLFSIVINQRNYRMSSISQNIAKYIILNDKIDQIITDFIQNEKSDYSDFIYYIGFDLFPKDSQKAYQILSLLKFTNTTCCNMIATRLLYRCIFFSIDLFEKLFYEFDILIDIDEVFWIELIPTYIEVYVQFIDKNCLSVIQNIEKRLLTVKDGSTPIKRSFFSYLRFENDTPVLFKDIFFTIIEQSFEKDRIIFDSLDRIFYTMLESNKINDVIKMLFSVFKANDYGHEYSSFYKNFDSTVYELSKYQKEICETVFDKIINGDIINFYFALGLLINNVSINDTEENIEINKYSEIELLTMLRGLLYFCVDSKFINNVAFQLLKLSDEDMPTYRDFYLNNVFENYPSTSYSSAKKYVDHTNTHISILANNVIDKYRKVAEISKPSYEIPDLKPSAERIYAFRRAQIEQNRKINSDENSISAMLFTKNVMRFGKRHAFIQIDPRSEWNFVESEYSTFSAEYELPKKFIEDPLLFSSLRIHFIKEKS